MTGEPLTAEETRALQLAANGLTDPRAAGELGISERTYRRIMIKVRIKLHAVNTTHAVYLAASAGMLPLPDESDQRKRDERGIDGGFSGCEYPRLWPPRRPTGTPR